MSKLSELGRQIIKRIIHHTPIYDLLFNWKEKRQKMKAINEWKRKGSPIPPPHLIKQQTLLNYAKKYKLKVLVETGTYYGDMVEAMRKNFDRIYSVELSKDLFDKAKERFKTAHNIELILGDSGKEIANIINKINERALFWLDGHYSEGVTAKGEKDTPILEELDTILSGPRRGNVIIIDDARSFGTNPAYPTIKELKEFVKLKKENVDIFIQNDSIRITPATKKIVDLLKYK